MFDAEYALFPTVTFEKLGVLNQIDEEERSLNRASLLLYSEKYYYRIKVI